MAKADCLTSTIHTKRVVKNWNQLR